MPNVDFSEQIEDFRSAKYGEEVRDSLIDIAEAVETAINNQLITVDDTLTESGQGADAAAVGLKLREINKVSVSEDEQHTTITVDSDGSTEYYVVPNDGLIGRMSALETDNKGTVVGAINELKSQIKSAESLNTEVIDAQYMNPTYSQGALNSDGTVNSNGIGRVTDYLPVVGGEKLTLVNTLTSKIAYYDSDKAFISLESVSTGINEYTVPNNAKYAKFQNVYSNGSPKPLFVRKKNQPSNNSFYDLVLSPIKSTPSVCITGDSNTYGYGLSDRETQAWPYLLMDKIGNAFELSYGAQSRWVESIGLQDYGNGYRMQTGQQMSIWTDARTLTFENTPYSATWDWYIDDVIASQFTSLTAITSDGSLHKFTVRITSGMIAYPVFKISKTITFVNKAVSGVGVSNLPIESGHDWLIAMIGTNNRGNLPNGLITGLMEYANRGTYIVPFPNHKTDSSYTNSELLTYSWISNIFTDLHFEIIDCSDVAGNLFGGDSLYQGDLIHFNAEGHKKIANLVGGKMGLPLYLETTESGDTGGDGLTSDIKSALIQLAQKVAYIDDDGQQYYNDLYDALYPALVITKVTLNTNSLSFGSLNSTQQLTATTTPSGGAITWSSSNTSVATVSSTGLVTAVGYGNATITATSGGKSATCAVTVAQATVTSISANYTQSETVYSSTSLDSLKGDLTVTATYSDESTATVADSDYTLSGELTEGTSTITVSYAGKTTTFNVTVTEYTGETVDGTALTWTRGFVDASGAVTTNGAQAGTYSSSLFETKSCSAYVVALSGSTSQRMAFYDSSKTFISRVLTASGAIPSNAVYARATIQKSSIGNNGYDGTGTTITLTV